MVPLGNGPQCKDAFIEIQCPVDAHAHLKDTRPNYRYDVLSVDNEYHGDYWTGLMLGVDSLADLEAIAKRLGGDVTAEDSRTNPYNHFQRPDGYVLGYQSAPRFARGRPDKWPMDMPGVYYYPEAWPESQWARDIANMKKMNLEFVPSHANFVLVKVGDGNAVFQKMLDKGVIVRAMAEYKLPAWVRISVGTMEQNRRCIATLSDVLNLS